MQCSLRGVQNDSKLFTNKKAESNSVIDVWNDVKVALRSLFNVEKS